MFSYKRLPSETPRSRSTTPSVQQQGRPWLTGWTSFLAGCLLISGISTALAMFELSSGLWQSHFASLQHLRVAGSGATADVLVMYVFSNTDPQYLDNLRFFLREGIHAADGCEYVFIVNRGNDDEEVELPPLPPNARYTYHANECFDWGTFGWGIKNQNIDMSKYKFFVFMNSSVRGPFIPTYLKGHVHWTDVLFSKLTETVKLVGPTINCEGSPDKGDVNGVWRKNPHVQSYLVATDQVGVNLLLQDERVFECYESMWDTIFHSELGSSKVILDAGYNIDSLMVRYQGVDWRDEANWGCNAERNPYGQNYLDGGSLEAMEVMFVKVKQRLLDQRWAYPVNAQLYDQWYKATEEGRPEVHRNRYVTDMATYKLPHVLAAAARGIDCFDCTFYAEFNPDLPSSFDCLALFDHYVNNGQFEGRPFRMRCIVPDEELLPYHPPPTGPALLPSVSKQRMNELLRQAALTDGSASSSRRLSAFPDSRDAIGGFEGALSFVELSGAPQWPSGHSRELQASSDGEADAQPAQQYLNAASRGLALL